MHALTPIIAPEAADSSGSGRRWRGAATILGLVAGSALLAGRFSPAPGNGGVRRFYRRLDKPDFNPPDPVFGIWGVLYPMIALSGLRIWNARASPTRTRALGFWTASQALSALWMWVGFGQRRLGPATAIAVGNVLTTAAFAGEARRIDRPAAIMTLPLVGWLGFAALLTEQLWQRNRSRSR